VLITPPELASYLGSAFFIRGELAAPALVVVVVAELTAAGYVFDIQAVLSAA
jgi:hypothetical protein